MLSQLLYFLVFLIFYQLCVYLKNHVIEFYGLFICTYFFLLNFIIDCFDVHPTHCKKLTQQDCVKYVMWAKYNCRKYCGHCIR